MGYLGDDKNFLYLIKYDSLEYGASIVLVDIFFQRLALSQSEKILLNQNVDTFLPNTIAWYFVT